MAAIDSLFELLNLRDGHTQPLCIEAEGESAARVIEAIYAIGQSGFLERPLRSQIARLADHRPENAPEAAERDHGFLRYITTLVPGMPATPSITFPVFQFRVPVRPT